jgi:hypothetical protein
VSEFLARRGLAGRCVVVRADLLNGGDMIVLAWLPFLVFICFMGYRILTVSEKDIYEHYY